VVLSFAVLATVSEDHQGERAAVGEPVAVVDPMAKPADGPREDDAQFELTAQKVVPAVLSFLFYLTTSFVIVFFNTALVCCTLARLNGGNPTVGYGLSMAMGRLPQILGWALLSATVGMILKTTERRLPMAGKIVIDLIGMAWAAVTFLVVPILAAEKLGPIAAVKRSAGILRKTWGESLVGQMSLGAVQFLFMLPAILVFVGIGFVVSSSEMNWLLFVVGAVAVLYLIVLAIVFSTLQQIFLTAVYQYAAQGTVPAGFSPELIESAFRSKEQK
jgi:hypothetical protein